MVYSLASGEGVFGNKICFFLQFSPVLQRNRNQLKDFSISRGFLGHLLISFLEKMGGVGQSKCRSGGGVTNFRGNFFSSDLLRVLREN